MNIKEYISSGILEAYVMGELSDKEATDVESKANEYKEIREEISRIEDTLEALAFNTAIAPKTSVKDGLFAKLGEGDEQKDNKGHMAALPVSEQKAPSGGFAKYLVAASVVIALTTSYLAFNYWQKWQNVSSELAALIAQNQRIAEDYNVVNRQLDQIEDDLHIINDTNFERVKLSGTEVSPEALTYIYWNRASADVYLSIQNLKELSEENQYQLWAIIDGKPVDAGVFDLPETGLIKMKSISGAVAFAVTIESRGGSESPSLETMQVYGETEAQG